MKPSDNWTTERLRIREFRLTDRPDLLEFVRDPDQLKFMLFNLATENDLDEFLGLAVGQAAASPRTQWHLAIEELGRPGVVGSVALMGDYGASRSAELGYWFKRSVWGRGYATEASRFALCYGFKTLGFHRIWGKCHVENPASARVMEHVGMVREGLIREHVWLRDHFRSSLQYSILEQEYQISSEAG